MSTTQVDIELVDNAYTIISTAQVGPPGPAGPAGDGGPGTNPWLIACTQSQTWAFYDPTYDSNGVCTSADVVWPDLCNGVYTADTVNSTWHCVDAYHVTYQATSGGTKTVTQAAISRDTSGRPTTIPILVVS